MSFGMKDAGEPNQQHSCQGVRSILGPEDIDSFKALLVFADIPYISTRHSMSWRNVLFASRNINEHGCCLQIITLGA